MAYTAPSHLCGRFAALSFHTFATEPMHFPGAGRLLMRAQHTPTGGGGKGCAAEMPAHYVTTATLSSGAVTRSEDAKRGAETSPRTTKGGGGSAPVAAATQGGMSTSAEQQVASSQPHASPPPHAFFTSLLPPSSLLPPPSLLLPPATLLPPPPSSIYLVPLLHLLPPPTNPNQRFSLYIDGELYGPFAHVVLTPCVAPNESAPITMPIRTFFPIEAPVG